MELNESSPLSLYELNSLVRGVLEHHLSNSLWLQAELSEVRSSRGHCYLEFVQKSADDNSLIANASGVIWRTQWNLLKTYFEQTTGLALSPGMQVLVKVSVSFHELYGYKLIVSDIDPTYTIGDLARKRQQILLHLSEEGIINMNRELLLPRIIKHIAVISSPSAAGWGDFADQLHSNQFGFAFSVQLFPATMQGADVESSLIRALDSIAENINDWDVVVIIRGGGSAADLSGFDSLLLAEYVAQFPIPIITGIGHERDDTVIDLIAHTRVKTPTAAAEMIISHQLDEWNHLCDLAEQLRSGVTNSLNNAKNYLEKSYIRLRLSSPHLIESQRHRLELFTQKISDANPDRLLRLGFSITRLNGKAVNSVSSLTPGSSLTITFADGTAPVKVT